MKRIGLICVIAAIACISLVSCQKNELISDVDVKTHSVKIIPSVTKTVIGSEDGINTTLKWTGDETVYAYENDNKANEAVLVSEDEGVTATIMATFDETKADSYKYHAIVAKSVSNAKNPLLPNEQTATATSYDSDADILISSVSATTSPATQISLQFARPVVINKMTLKDLTAGEKINSVEFTASCNLAGRIKPNFETGNIDEYGISDTKKTIVVSYKNNEVANPGGTFPVYFVTFPTLTEEGCGNFTVVVRTNKYVYTKNVTEKTLEFKLNKKTDFKLGLADAEKEEVHEDVVYTLVKSNADLFDGAEYIIAAAGSDYAMGQWSGGNNHPQVSITKVISDGVSTITTNNASGVLPIKISKESTEGVITYYSLQNASSDDYAGYYLAKTGTKNYLTEKENLDDAGKWIISISNGVATITNKGASSYEIRYNSTNNPPIFSSYTTGQADVALYINKATCIEKVGDPNLMVSQTGANEVTASWTAVEHAAGYELYFGEEKVEGYSQDGNNYSYVFTNLTVGETYTFRLVVKADDGYKDNTVTKELTIANLQLVNPTPTISQNSITSSSFVASWAAVANAGSYAYYVTQNSNRISGYETDKTTDETTITIEGLDANTEYVFHIKTKKVEESLFVEPNEYATANATTLNQDVIWNLDHITITNPPTKKKYTTIEAFDPTGMVVTATYKEDSGFNEKNEVVPLKVDDNDGYTFTPDGNLTIDVTEITISYNGKTAKVTGITVTEPYKLVENLSDIIEGTYCITAFNTDKYYTVPNTTLSGQTFTCTEATVSNKVITTLPEGAGEFEFISTGSANQFYIYNTNLQKYLVATGSKKFGYVDNTSNDYGYWTFSDVNSGGYSGVFSVKHSGKTQYMRAYNNSVRCYDSASNQGVYLFKR